MSNKNIKDTKGNDMKQATIDNCIKFLQENGYKVEKEIE